jgi:hypothetical protein
MSDHDNLTTRDLAESRSTGEETAQDMPLTREDHEDHSDTEMRERPAEADRDTVVATGPETPRADRADAANEATGSLLPAEQSDRFEQRWHEIQTSFVDEPREAVEQADTLVAELMQELASGFSETRSRLEAQWDDEGGEVSTEDLRVALTRYRSFFNRLLSA